MSGKVEIKVATPANAEVIAEILTKAFSQFESNYTPEALEYVTPRAEEIRGRFKEGPIWIALRPADRRSGRGRSPAGGGR